MQHSCSHYIAFRSIPWQTRTYLRTWQHQMTTMKQPFQCDLQPEIQETHRTTHTDTTTRCKTHRRNQFAHETTPAAPVAQTRYLSSSAAATLHGKTQGFMLRLPPHNTAACNIHAATLHGTRFRSSGFQTRTYLRHVATSNDDNAAIPMQSATTSFKKPHRTTHTGHNHSLQNT